jgi:hypothetical protein
MRVFPAHCRPARGARRRVVLQKIFWPQLVELESHLLPQYLVSSESFCNTTWETIKVFTALEYPPAVSLSYD